MPKIPLFAQLFNPKNAKKLPIGVGGGQKVRGRFQKQNGGQKMRNEKLFQNIVNKIRLL